MSTAVSRPTASAAWVLVMVPALAALAVLWTASNRVALIAVVGIPLALAILRYPVAGFVLIAFTVPWGSAVTGATAGPTEAVVGLLGVAWLAAAVVERRNPWGNAVWTPYLLLLLAAMVLSVTQATDRAASAREVLKWGELATVYWSAVFFLRSRREVHAVLAAVALGGVSQALLGFVQSGLALGPAAFAGERLFLRAYGTFDQPNPFAGYLNMTWPAAFGLALAGGPARRRWGVAAAVIGGGILVSESRGALLAGAFALALVLALVSRGWAVLVRLGVLALLAGGWALSFGLQLSPLQRVLSAIGLGQVSFNTVDNSNYAAVERAAHWLAGVRMFAAHPLLGVGIGNYSAAYPVYHPRGWYPSLSHAHNYYINIAAEAGIVGLTAYLLFLGAAFWYALGALRVAYNRTGRAAALALIGALAATSVHNIFDVLYVHGTTALIGLLMAAAIGPGVNGAAEGTTGAATESA